MKYGMTQQVGEFSRKGVTAVAGKHTPYRPPTLANKEEEAR